MQFVRHDFCKSWVQKWTGSAYAYSHLEKVVLMHFDIYCLKLWENLQRDK